MIEQALIGLESLPWVSALRGSTLAYPLVNAGHILGIALLVGGILPLDLRLLGLWRGLPLVVFVTALRTTAAFGLGLAVFCGALLFATAAPDYAASWLFQAKLVVVLVGVLNVWLLARVLRTSKVQSLPLDATMPLGLRIGAAASLLAWLAALVLGRLVGYY